MPTTQRQKKDDKPRPVFRQTKHLAANRQRRRKTALKVTLILVIVALFLSTAIGLWLAVVK